MSPILVPLLVLGTLANVIGTWGLFKLALLFRRASGGSTRHIFYPIVIATRWLRGVSTWHPWDFGIQQMPRTEAHRDLARAQGFQSRPCTCGEPECKKFVWFPPGFDPDAMLEAQRLFGPGGGPPS